jgi:class 3 adenylate cyclase/pimeloyl-ACP methyl ester carboxylesterase
MEPRIQYASAADGTSIAFWAIGEGPTLVCPPPACPWSHIEQEWRIDAWRHWYEHLTETFRVIRYDNRGSGMSQREVPTIDLETHTADLEAVVDRLGVDRFALFAVYFSSPAAIAYAVRHPERVSHLVLWCPVTGYADDARDPTQQALDTLIEGDYGLFTETLAHTVFGWESGAEAHQLALYMQAALTAEQARRCWNDERLVAVTDLLPMVTQPTLVMHRRDFPYLTMESVQQTVARIPDARLKLLEGRSLSPYVGDIRQVLEAVQEFVGIDPAEARAREVRHAHQHTGDQPAVGFRTILFTDMEESTALTQRLGDEQAQEIVRVHNGIVDDALRRHGGTRIKHTGDGIMASFFTASAALEASLDIQRVLAYHNDTQPAQRVAVRIGINAGEPVAEGDDLFGTAVQLASRVCAKADPGEILTTDVVRQLVAGKGFLFHDRGDVLFRGFEDPVRVFEVRWRADAG